MHCNRDNLKENNAEAFKLIAIISKMTDSFCMCDFKYVRSPLWDLRIKPQEF